MDGLPAPVARLLVHQQIEDRNRHVLRWFHRESDERAHLVQAFVLGKTVTVFIVELLADVGADLPVRPLPGRPQTQTVAETHPLAVRALLVPIFVPVPPIQGEPLVRMFEEQVQRRTVLVPPLALAIMDFPLVDEAIANRHGEPVEDLHLRHENRLFKIEPIRVVPVLLFGREGQTVGDPVFKLTVRPVVDCGFARPHSARQHENGRTDLQSTLLSCHRRVFEGPSKAPAVSR